MSETASIFQASAPGRCGILGNPSDIYGGKVLSCSVPARAVCRIALGGVSRLPGDLRLWNAAVARFPLDGPVAVDWNTEIPRSSGLSGSTALLAATLATVMKAVDKPPDLDSPHGLIAFAELLRDVERNEADIVCGYQDAYMIVHGGLQLMDFAGKHPAQPGPTANLRRIDAPLPFLLVTTGVERLSGSVHGPMAQRWLSGDAEVRDAMLRIADLTERGAQALVSADYPTLAQAMDENHRLIAGLGGSGDSIDLLIARCKHHGALSAKLAGAGLGGTVIALTEDVHGLQRALEGEGYKRFLVPAIEPGVR